MSYTFYRLCIAPAEGDGEGEDHDEWFTSEAAARKRRAELIREDPDLEGHLYGCDFEIYKVELAKLSPKLLMLCVLNRKSYMKSSECIEEVYRPKRKREKRID